MVRLFRSSRNKFIRMMTSYLNCDVNYLKLTCITVIVLLVIAIATTTTDKPTYLTRIPKYEVDVAQIQNEAVDTIVIEQPDGGAYIAFQLPEYSKIVKALRDGRLRLKEKTKTTEVRPVKPRDEDFIDSRFPLTIRDHPYEIINEDVCKNVKNLQFVVLVHSSTTNFMRRSSIRETWANYKIFKKQNMRIVFLLGKPEHDSTQVLIEHENSLHKDIIQGRFLDTYRNLTHKGVLGIRWISEYCKETTTVVKVDDDVFVNVFKLMDDVINKYSKESRKIYCPVRPKGTSLIQRNEGKWRIGNDDFRNMTHYPVIYCNGYFTVFTADLASEMFEVSKSTPFFWIDDIYIYGLLPDKLENVTFTGLPNLHLNENYSIECFESRNKTCELLVANAHSEGVMDKLWYRALEQYRELAQRYSKDELF